MIFESIFFRTLRNLQTGRLTVRLPDGEARVFGGLSPEIRAEIVIRDRAFFRRCVQAGPIGFAESHIAGEWDTPDLVALIAFFILNTEHAPNLDHPENRANPLLNLWNAYNRVLHKRRKNSIRKSRENIREHYDLSNDFFRLWLDPGMTYSSAVFDPPGISLEEAQAQKYEALCRKLDLRAGERLLEIGCGWGGMALHAAKTRGCKVTGLTISEEQFAEARRRVAREGLENLVNIEFLDYRLAGGFYDKIVSIEMIEAVGDEYLDGFFAKCASLLKPHGMLALQMITCPDRQFPILRDGVDFIQKHIFPGSLLVSQRRINEATVRTGDLNLLDWEDYGPHYARTLKLWRETFDQKEEQVLALGFDPAFVRKWRYYLAYCEAAFGTRHISVVHAVFSRPDNLSLRTPVYQLPFSRRTEPPTR